MIPVCVDGCLINNVLRGMSLSSSHRNSEYLSGNFSPKSQHHGKGKGNEDFISSWFSFYCWTRASDAFGPNVYYTKKAPAPMRTTPIEMPTTPLPPDPRFVEVEAVAVEEDEEKAQKNAEAEEVVGSLLADVVFVVGEEWFSRQV
jgi:hypothetical protein